MILDQLQIDNVLTLCIIVEKNVIFLLLFISHFINMYFSPYVHLKLQPTFAAYVHDQN